MKSPVKRNWKVFVAWTSLGTALTIFIVLVKSFFLHQNFDPLQIIMLLSIIVVFAFVGLVEVLYGPNNLLHRQVSHPVDPWHIEYEKTYWLNGETQARYIGTNKYTGKLGFNIFGVGNYTTSTKDAQYFLPGEVGEYFSENQEVFPKKKK